MILFKVTPDQIRNLLSKSNIRQANSQEAEAFLTLYSEQLETVITDAVKTFVARKMA